MTRNPGGRNRRHRLPSLAGGLLRVLLPYAERDEVLEDLAEEHESRARASGRLAAGVWVWRQVFSSIPSLLGRGWWRGWSGFEPRANWTKPGGAMLESWAQDVRYGLRRLAQRPMYTTLTVLTLALGVAGTSAVYSIAKQVLLDPLPVRDEQNLVMFWLPGYWSEAEFAFLREENHGFESMAAIRPGDVILQERTGAARLLPGVSGSAELFEVLGVPPLIGTGFRPQDDLPGSEPVVVLSHSLWQELGGDGSIIGERLELSGVERTVVGVMPEGFWFSDPDERIWISETVDPQNGAGNRGIIARMPEARTIEGMRPALANIGRMLRERFTYPSDWDKTKNPEITPIREYLVGSIRPALLATLGAVVMILLIACVNVAALMLGQVDGRGMELAVRSALGAGRRRLLQQIVIESLALGLLAGIAGAVLAALAFRFIAAALPLGALAAGAGIDWTLFWSSTAIAIVAATAVGLAPAFTIARSNLQTRLTRGRTGGVEGRGGRLESGLVVAQVALVVLMAAGAALLIRSVGKLRAIESGLDTGRVAVIDILMPAGTDMAERPALLRHLVDAVAQVPGVDRAAATSKLPLRGAGDDWWMGIETRPELTTEMVYVRQVTPGYLETLGISRLAGRGLEERDRTFGDEGIVVINQALADRYFRGEDPIGKRIAFMPERWDRIVGVVETVAETNLSDPPAPTRYYLFEHTPWVGQRGSIAIRTRGIDPAAILDPARRALQSAAPAVAVRELTTMERVFTRAIGPAQQVMALLALLGGVALLLGAIGVYGVVSHYVIRRKRDWSIRIALGMPPSRVIRQIVGRGGALVGAGAALGLIAFIFAARLIAGFLYGVGTADPISLASATAVLVAAGLLAAYVPARRASRIDPAGVLREQ